MKRNEALEFLKIFETFQATEFMWKLSNRNFSLGHMPRKESHSSWKMLKYSEHLPLH